MKITLDLTKTEFEQLLKYAEWAADSRVYYGNKKQFKNRYEKIRLQLQKAEAAYAVTSESQAKSLRIFKIGGTKG